MLRMVADILTKGLTYDKFAKFRKMFWLTCVWITFVLFSFSIALRLPDSVSAFVGISFQLAANVLTGFASRTFQLYFSKWS